MSNVDIIFQNNKYVIPQGTLFADFLKEQLGENTLNSRKIIAVKLNDKSFDLYSPIQSSGTLVALEITHPEALHILRHSMAHLLAHAITSLYPDAKPTIGPPTEDGFFYDFDMPPITEEDLPRIEEKMTELVKAQLPIKRLELPKEKLIEFYQKGILNPYKVYMIQNKVEEGVGSSLYEQGDFKDLCMGPHVPNTKYLEAFKLVRFSNAYWLGKSENKSLIRIYGYGFADKKTLKEHLNLIEEAKKRQHQKLGKDLDLFSFNELSPGGPFFHPKGAIIYNELLSMLRAEYFKRGYSEVITPLVYRKELWLTSRHWDHYKENMLILEKQDENVSGLKPMNCPSHFLIYKTKVRSYRELPIRYADFAALHRNEPSGSLMGLIRVIKFSQDDSHIFCRLNQIESELKNLFDFIDYIYSKIFGFKYHIEFSTRPAKFAGAIETWNKAEAIIEESLKRMKVNYKINAGDGAFYGPKIDFHLYDALGRTHQCATIQLDFVEPEYFDLTYVDENNTQDRVVVIHRAILGSLERFIGILVEHYAGKFPVWLSPVQVCLMGISDAVIPHLEKAYTALRAEFIRAELDLSAETLNKKIRNAQLDKIPYMLIIGEREAENGTVSIRTREGKQFNDLSLENVISGLKDKIRSKDINLDFTITSKSK